MTSMKYSLTIHNFGGFSGEAEKKQKRYFFQVLDAIQSTFSSFTIEREAVILTIDIDWSHAISDYRQYHTYCCSISEAIENFKLVQDQYRSFDEYIHHMCEKIPKSSVIMFALESESDDILLIEQILINFIYHLFLALNLSCPGFFELYSGVLNGRYEERINVSNEYFSRCWADASWPLISYIPVQDVKRWYDKLGLWGSSLGQDSVVKSLFALLHFCSEDKISPSKTIWLAHAIEAIYELPQAAILQTMKERILLVLPDQGSNPKEIIKKLNDFYQYRSNFVHGNLDIYIPSEMILERDEHDTYVDKLIQTEEFAFKLLIATLQKMIKQDWCRFNFATIVNGSSL